MESSSSADNYVQIYPIDKSIRDAYEVEDDLKLEDLEDMMELMEKVIKEDKSDNEEYFAEVDDSEELTDTQFLRQRCHHLARSFHERTQKTKRRMDFPPTPSTISSDPGEANVVNVSPTKVSKLESVSEEWLAHESPTASCGIIESQSCFYITWLTIVTLSFCYNAFVIPLRTTFPYQTEDNTITWLVVDFSMDALYVIDVIFIKPRIMFLEDGFWVRDIKRTRRNYFRKHEFKMDVLSLLPLDLLYFYIGTNHPLLRFPRFFKIHSFWEFINHFDKVMPSPYIVRVARTLTYMIYLVHINACAYYKISVFEGLGFNKWVYNGLGNAYVRCIYFAVKTATSIGKNPRPENKAEYLFMTACWLMGVFVFAVLIGQIRDIITTATRAQTEYRKRMDETLTYLRQLNLPPNLIERVKMWFSYTWQQQHTLDEARLLDTLPHKMKTDVAINVHFNTLNKVQLFKDCDEALLRELVLKLRPVLYLPGDYICRKGEVGKEMYIVKSGRVQVVSDDGKEVLATLSEGSVFGEISLLSIGCNRRTADVRSNGFSSLFVLNKDDLNSALVFHPQAQEILKKKARELIKQNADREKRQKAEAEILIKNHEPAQPEPKLLPVVMKVLPPNSGSARLLKYGSCYGRRYSYKYSTKRKYGRKIRFHGEHSFHSTKNDLVEKKVNIRKCHSIDLGQISSLINSSNLYNLTETSPVNISSGVTFECNVTVHNEQDGA